MRSSGHGAFAQNEVKIPIAELVASLITTDYVLILSMSSSFIIVLFIPHPFLAQLPRPHS